MVQTLFVIALAIGHLAVVVWVLLTEKRQPTATLACIQAVLFLPVVGALWVWETSWPIIVRLVLVVGLAGWSLAMFMPRTTQG